MHGGRRTAVRVVALALGLAAASPAAALSVLTYNGAGLPEPLSGSSPATSG